MTFISLLGIAPVAILESCERKRPITLHGNYSQRSC